MKRMLSLALGIVLLVLCLSSCEKDPPIGAPYDREITVSSGEERVVPYEHFAYASRRVKGGDSSFALIDGLPVSHILYDGSDTLKDIPVLTKTENVSVEFGENGEWRGIIVYNSQYNMVEIVSDDINSLDVGEWYVAVMIEWTGNYVPSVKAHEKETYAYVFKLIVNS